MVGVAVLLKLIYGPWYLNYDARYALLWARDALRGLSPEYKADFAPTPHPLETAASMLAVPFGQGGAVLMSWLILLAFGLLVWLTFRLGAELFHPCGRGRRRARRPEPAGARARRAARLPGHGRSRCLIVGAVLLEARRPRRGEAVLALLAVAGLMRPEAWVLGGLYVLWMWPRAGTAQRARLLGLTVLAPLVWAVSDALVTGDPLHSLHGTADLAEAVDRRRDIVDAPYWTAQYFGYSLREPLVIGIPVGLFFAWRFRRRAALLPLAVVAAMTLVFMIGPVFGLPLIGRYVRTPSVLLTLFYGLAVCGWLTLSDPRARRLLDAGSGSLARGALDRLPALARRHARGPSSAASTATARCTPTLRDTARAPAVRRAVAECGGRISAADYRPLPHLRCWLGTDPGSVGTTFAAGASPRATSCCCRAASR